MSNSNVSVEPILKEDEILPEESTINEYSDKVESANDPSLIPTGSVAYDY